MSVGAYADSEPVSGPVAPSTICVGVTPGVAAPRGGTKSERRERRDEREPHRETAFFSTDRFSVTRPIVICAVGCTAAR